MKKKLSEMSLKELWLLFPIIIKKHNPNYLEWYQAECDNLLILNFSDNIERINHIGSTSVEDLAAKPIIDILMEIAENCDISALIKELENNNWILMNRQDAPILKLAFNKGYTQEGFAKKVFHLHVRYRGSWDELYFRDYLLENQNVREEYESLKYLLLDEYENDRDGYTSEKAGFIDEKTALAREEYQDKYK